MQELVGVGMAMIPIGILTAKKKILQFTGIANEGL